MIFSNIVSVEKMSSLLICREVDQSGNDLERRHPKTLIDPGRSFRSIDFSKCIEHPIVNRCAFLNLHIITTSIGQKLQFVFSLNLNFSSLPEF